MYAPGATVCLASSGTIQAPDNTWGKVLDYSLRKYAYEDTVETLLGDLDAWSISAIAERLAADVTVGQVLNSAAMILAREPVISNWKSVLVNTYDLEAQSTNYADIRENLIIPILPGTTEVTLAASAYVQPAEARVVVGGGLAVSVLIYLVLI